VAAQSAANTRVACERDYGRFRAFIGTRSLRRVGLGDLSDFTPDSHRLAGHPPPHALGDESAVDHRLQDGRAALQGVRLARKSIGIGGALDIVQALAVPKHRRMTASRCRKNFESGRRLLR